MNDDLISRKLAIKEFRDMCVGECGCCSYCEYDGEDYELCRLLMELPAVDLNKELKYWHDLALSYEHTINKLTKAISEQPEVIRCKDCKYRPISLYDGSWKNVPIRFPDYDNNPCPCKLDDSWYSWIPPDDWFCAEGERKGEKDG